VPFTPNLYQGFSALGPLGSERARRHVERRRLPGSGELGNGATKAYALLTSCETCERPLICALCGHGPACGGRAAKAEHPADAALDLTTAEFGNAE
jgi:hypothetical protein